MNTDMIIKETNIWGQFNNVRNMDKRIKLMKKRQLIGMEGFPFVDHYTIYAYKHKHQKGPAREEQTFILSYAYNYDSYENEAEFINVEEVKFNTEELNEFIDAVVLKIEALKAFIDAL